MTAQVLLFNIFSEKDPDLNVVEISFKSNANKKEFKKALTLS